MIKKLIISIVIGILCALHFVERDPWISRSLACTCKDFFSTTYACQLQTDKDDVSLFSPCLTSSHATINPKAGTLWHWKAAQVKIGFSWWQFLLYGVVSLYVHIDAMEVEITSPQGLEAFKQHLMSMMNPGNSLILCRLDELVLDNLQCHYTDAQQQIESRIKGQVVLRRCDGSIRSLVTLDDGSCTKEHKNIIEQLRGSLQCDTGVDMQATSCELDGELSGVVSLLPSGNNKCFLRGSWRHGAGTCTLINKDHTCSIDPISVKKTSDGYAVKAHITTQLAHLYTLMGLNKVYGVDGQGTADVDLHVYDDLHYDANINLRATRPPFSLVCQSAFTSLDTMLHGTASIVHHDQEQAQGSWTYNKTTGSFNLKMDNSKAHQLPWCSAWMLGQGDCSCDVTYDQASGLSGSYRCSISNKYKKNTITTSATVTSNGSTLACKGVCGSLSYNADIDLVPSVRLRTFKAIVAEKQPVVTIETLAHKHKPLHATIEVSALRFLAKLLYDYTMQAAGKLIVDAVCQNSCIQADIRFVDGSFCIPHIYNVVHGMRAKVLYDQCDRTLTVTNLVCALHKGSLTVDHAVAMHDAAGAFVYWYLPVLIKNGLITSGQNFFAHVSGYLVASYKDSELPHLKADLLLERSYIKENIFSDSFAKKIGTLAQASLVPTIPDATCDLKIETVAPIKVQTPFLEADARMVLHVHNKARSPQISGELKLVSGSLLFPYRPLLITKGVVSMMADRPHDPLIELVAQNQVRNHNITMHVTGSLLQHHFMFESIPALTQEQIIALLLVGSQEESLNIVMPTLIMQNLASLVFGSTQSSGTLERIFNKFMQPFKGIHIVPRFTDQSSRGGLRGVIDIEVNDRWRAMIQKNFKLTEDTRFELEYQATDDVSLRAIRDEHRDMGAEVEMRWKF